MGNVEEIMNLNNVRVLMLNVVTGGETKCPSSEGASTIFGCRIEKVKVEGKVSYAEAMKKVGGAGEPGR